jgi:serine/threonine-protein kinase RsbW
MDEQPPSPCEFDPDHLLLRLETTLTADGAAAEAFIERIMALVGELGCAPGREPDVQLALEEALTNAIVHGCRRDPTKQIECRVLCDREHGMLIVVRDPGPGFDPAAVPSPLVGENLFATHGRGIFLINQMVDQVDFARGGTEIRMRVKRSGS